MEQTKLYRYDINAIRAILPHRPPFQFVDGVVKLVADKCIVAERRLDPAEPFFAGHFPGKAIMPGVLIVEALAQTSGLLWGFSKQERGGETSADPEIFFLASSEIKFVNPAYPGETLTLQSTASRSFGTLFAYEVEAFVGRRQIAKGALKLAMINGAP
jgi:3-hydroxyacyl-[acyl-carrier-protein] dehydratase